MRAGGRPHLVPVWFVYWEGQFYICIEPGSVKAGNMRVNPAVALALEDGSRPVICEGHANAVPAPWPANVAALFQEKYDWNILTDAQYSLLLRIKPQKWLGW